MIGGQGRWRGNAPLARVITLAADLLDAIQGPDPEKDKIIRWRCLDLQAEIARRFSVRVHESTVGKRCANSVTRLQARPCHPKTDFAAQEAFKKTLPA